MDTIQQKYERIHIMKKLLAIALCALMVVCAALPAMAAPHTTKDGAEIESLVPNAELPDEFIEAGELAALDYLDQNASLTLETDYWTRPEGHSYGGAGISVAPGVKYAMTFEIEEAGTYEFCVSHFVRRDDQPAGYPHASSVQIDDGPLYSVNEDDADAITLGAINYYTGLTVELEAGEHTFYFVGDYSNGINAYFGYVYFYNVDGESAADNGDDAADDTDAPAADDNDAPSTPTAPATFDASLIALAVAGVSAAAAAVVSKKRR